MLKKTTLLTFLLSTVTSLLIAQNKADRENIKSKSNLTELNRLEKKFNKDYINLVTEAKSLNISLEKASKTNSLKTLSNIKNGVPSYDVDDNSNAANTGRINRIWNGGASGLNLSGSGIEIGHWEASGIPRTTHVELSGSVSNPEGESTSSHASHTAGTMIASGVNNSARGMASSATIVARKSNNDESEMAAFAGNGGILSNHSYTSSNPNGDLLYYGYYSTHAQEWDEIAYNAPYYLICKSAGNLRNDGVNTGDGGYDVLYSQGVAKNLLVIGAVDDVANYTGPGSISQTAFSGYGPTDDWRIKPDLVANGQSVWSCDDDNNVDYTTKSGTSMATPSVTGAIALLQEHHYNENSEYMKSATVKALLINSADEAGSNPGPDFANGWGLLNAEAASELITNNNSSSKIFEHTIDNGQTVQFTVTVDGTNPLTLAMVWTDPAATPFSDGDWVVDQSDTRLINDLDVRITGNSNTYLPWVINTGSFTNPASTGDNFRDNVEKIDVSSLTSGTYTVSITHKGTLSDIVNGQEFSLIIDGITGSSLSTPSYQALNQSITLYPNPTENGELFVKLQNPILTISRIKIYDLTGKELINQDELNSGSNKIDVSDLTSGLYYMTIQTDIGVINKKFIVK